MNPSAKEERQQIRMRRRTSKRLGDPDKKESARQAAALTAERIRKSAFTASGSTFYSNVTGELNGSAVVAPSSSMSIDSVSLPTSLQSELSWEGAMRRGSQRGSREANETGSIADDYHSEFDITTVTEAVTDDVTKASNRRKTVAAAPKKKKIGWKAKHKTPSHASGNGPSANDGDAWMCGVCGRAFSNLDAADRHENQHIQQVVASLGWAGEPGFKSILHANSFLNTPSNARDGLVRRRRLPSFGEAAESPAMSGDTASARNGFPKSAQFDFPEEEKVSEDLLLGDGKPAARWKGSMRPHPIRTIVPQFDTELPEGALIPKPRARTNSEVRFDTSGPTFEKIDDTFSGDQQEDGLLLISNSMRDYVVLADEALINVCERAESFILTQPEMEAERELKLLARDKLYYDQIAERSLARKKNPSNRYRTDEKGIRGKLQNKFVDAYQLMKEGDAKTMNDQYNRKRKGADEISSVIVHTDKTLFVNVMVKNSVQVVRHELQRLARKRWENMEETESFTRFERFRVYAHMNIVKLAGIALASDFTPRRIAVQLSNDLYRLLTPRLKRRGVTIETEIEYRVGPYFVLAVNITTIDWRRLIRATYNDVNIRKAKWKEDNRQDAADEQEEASKCFLRRWMKSFQHLVSMSKFMSKFDVLAQFLAWLYHFHWTIYLPICLVSYYTVLGPIIRSFIITGVTDEIFFYVEEKGMEMEIEVRRAANQAAFMLSALREIRADGRELKKKRQETESEEKGSILGPLLGPAFKADKGPAIMPPGFVVPDNLEFVGLELDLPVGLRRLRWAVLSAESQFIIDALYKTEAKYEDINVGEWSKHKENIGNQDLPDSVEPEDFVGAERGGTYVMPKSAFVSAMLATETQYILAYNDYCFCLKKKSLTPTAPFGSTFVAWTQYLFINTGNDSSRVYCSVEAEFPNGPPLVSRQIKSGMRAGTGELFVLFGATITKYADEYPLSR